MGRMATMLDTREVATTTATIETARYKVSVYTADSEAPLAFDVGSLRLANEAVEWCSVDPRVTRIEVTDMLTNRRIKTWVH